MIYPPYNNFQQVPNPMVQQTQQNGLIPVRSEQEVLNFPVAPGNSVSFSHESEPYIYVKTMGLSQFDRPSIVKYKLIKEELGSETTNPNNSSPNDTKTVNEGDLKPILDDLKLIHDEIESIKKKIDDIDKVNRKQTTQAKEK